MRTMPKSMGQKYGLMWIPCAIHNCVQSKEAPNAMTISFEQGVYKEASTHEGCKITHFTFYQVKCCNCGAFLDPTNIIVWQRLEHGAEDLRYFTSVEREPWGWSFAGLVDIPATVTRIPTKSIVHAPCDNPENN